MLAQLFFRRSNRLLTTLHRRDRVNCQTEVTGVLADDLLMVSWQP
jgi:hypothetical protein